MKLLQHRNSTAQHSTLARVATWNAASLRVCPLAPRALPELEQAAHLEPPRDERLVEPKGVEGIGDDESDVQPAAALLSNTAESIDHHSFSSGAPVSITTALGLAQATGRHRLTLDREPSSWIMASPMYISPTSWKTSLK